MKIKRGLFIVLALVLLSITFIFASPLINFISPTPSNQTSTTNTSIEINLSITEPSLGSLIYNWNGTNFTLYDDSLVLYWSLNNNSNLGDTVLNITDLSRYSRNGTVSNTTIHTFESNAETWAYRDGGFTTPIRDCTTAATGSCSINMTSTIAGTGSNYITTATYPKNNATIDFDYKCESSNFKWGLLINDGSAWNCIQGTGTTGCGSTYTAKGSLSPSITCDNTWRHASYNMDWGAGTISQTIIGDWSGTNTANQKLWIDNFIISKSVTYVSGKYGNSFYFDGVNDYIITPSLSSSFATDEVTLSVWFKANSSGIIVNELGQTDISSGYRDSNIEVINSTGAVKVRVWNLGAVYLGSVNFGTWNHVVLRYNTTSNLLDGFLNGIKSYSNSSGDRSSPVDNAANQYYALGSTDITHLGSGAFFNGSIDEFKVWNKSLTDQEAYQDYISSLQKYNSAQWYLYINQSKNATAILDNGTYSYQVFATNSSGSINSTDLRILNIGIDTISPQINFISPTLLNSTSTQSASVELNISISEQNLNSTIYNWNTTNFTIYNDSLLFMMNFDNQSSLGDNSSYVVDVSNYRNNGILYGAIINSSSGKYGSGGYFDGIDDNITLLNEGNFDFERTNSISGCAWIYSKSFSGANSIISKLGETTTGWEFTQWDPSGSADGLAVYLISSWPGNVIQAYSNETVSINNWYHVCFTYNGGSAVSSVKIYLNGRSQTVYSGADTLSASILNNNPVTIGSRGNALYYNGSIDEVRIWNRSLTADEVYEQYVSNLNKFNSTQWYFYVNQSKNATTGLDNGTYSYQVFATDLIGNANSSELRYITIDTIIPNATLLTPANNSIVNNQTQNFTANITDNSGIKNATINIYNESNNLVNRTTTNYSQGTITKTVGIVVVLVDGVYKWFYDIFDWAGNNYVTENNTIIINATPPKINFIGQTPVDNYISRSNSTFIEVSSSSSVLHSTLLDWNSTLRLWLRLNNESSENHTFVKDWSTFSNNATYNGTIIYNTTSILDKGITFNTSSYLTINNNSSLLLNDSLTIEGWINIEPSTGASASATSCTAILNNGLSTGDGIYTIDTDGSGGNESFNVYCDMTTDGGGWTLLSWTNNSATSRWGPPYPGLAYCSNLSCWRGSGVNTSNVQNLLRLSNTFGKGQSTASKNTYSNLGSYTYAGKYVYRSLSNLSIVYGSVSASGLVQGTFVNITGCTQNGTAVYLNQYLVYQTYNFASDSTDYIWHIGVPGSYGDGSGNLPGSWQGTWSSTQYGPGQANTAGSYSVWVKGDSSSVLGGGGGGSTGLGSGGISKSGAYQLLFNNNSATGYINSQSINSSISYGWHHVAITYDKSSSQIKLYIDGSLKNNVSYSSEITQNTNSLLIGQNFNGTLDEIRIYSRALSESEINASFNASQYQYSNNFTNLADGIYTYKAHTTDSLGNTNSTEQRTITIAANPQILLNLISPTANTNTNVNKGEFFSVIVNVTCKNNNCGSVNVSLDPATEESQEFCGFDYGGGNCAFTSNLCTDSYDTSLYPSGGTKTFGNSSIRTTNSSTTINSVTFKIYQTCNSPVINFTLNNVVIGSTTGNSDCTCTPNPYPRIYNITNPTLLNSLWLSNQNNIFNVTLTNSPAFAGFKVIVNYTSSSTKNGLINTTTGATPFYTTTQNPYNVTLNQDDSQIITWSVNATGSIGSNYTFFVYANLTSNFATGNNSARFNISIVNGTNTDTTPVVNLLSPTNATITTTSLVYFAVNATDNLNVTNLTLYIWNSTGSIINTTTNITGRLSSITNYSVNLSYNNIFKWNYLACDNSSSCAFNSTNFTIIYDTTYPNATLLTPANNSVVNNQTQNFTANVSDNIGIKNATLSIYNESNNLVNRTTTNYSQGTITKTVGIVVVLVDGVYKWFYDIFDWAGNNYVTENNTVTIDAIYPSFSAYQDNNASIVSGETALFNVTVANTNGSVWLSINGTNYTATNLTSNKYNVSITGLTNNTYAYNWSAYGNSSSHLLNMSAGKSFTINATPDTTLPYFTTRPSNPTIYVNTSVAYQFVATDTILFGTYAVNDTTNFNINSTGYLKNLTALSAGIYNLNITINDSSNNRNSTIFIITVNAMPDSTLPLLSFISPTQLNATSTSNKSFEINVSISEQNLNSLIYNWNTTNFTIYNDSLLLMMNFNNLSFLGENSTKVVDVSKYSNNGTVTNGAIFNSSGKYNGAYQFDGIDDYIDFGIPSSIQGQYALTLSAWVKTSSTTAGYRDIIANQWQFQNSGIMLTTNGASTIHVPWSNGVVYDSYDVTYTIADGVWHFIATTFSNGNITIYADGNLIGSKVSSTAVKIGYNNANHLLIGKDSGTGGTEYWNGSIDEVRIWNRSLNANEIYQQYISNLNRFNSTQWYFYVNQSKNATIGLDVANYTYQVFANDLVGNTNSTPERTIRITQVPDTSYPTFSNYQDNNASIVSGETALFNVTVANTNGSVWLSINGTNYTATNLTSNKYNVSITGLTNNTYAYNWSAYGNGSSHLLNMSAGKSFTINATPDTTLPYFTTRPSNPTIYVNTSVAYQFVATDAISFGTYSVNDTTNFNINSTGYLKNLTALSAGIYNLNITINDSSNNRNSTIFIMTVNAMLDSIIPQLTFLSPTPLNATSTSNKSFEINVSISEQNLNSLIYNWNTTNYTIYNDGLVLMMNFDNRSSLGENSTKVVDISKYGNNGTVSGAGWNESGKYNGAYTFDGSDDSINLNNPSSLQINENITVMFWINPNSITGTWDFYIGKTDPPGWSSGWGFWSSNDNQMHFYTGHYSTNDVSTSFSANTWQHFTGVANSTHIKIFKNGVLMEEGEDSDRLIDYAGSLFIGSSGSDSYNLNGNIDEVRIWNRSLSASEVYQQYISNLNRFNSTQWYFYVNQSKNATIGLDVANYTYKVFANDSTGNVNSTPERTIRITASADTTAPNLRIVYPTNTSYNINISDLNYTLNEAGNCWYSRTNGLTNLTQRTAGINFTHVTSVEGNNNWTVYCNDSSNNINKSTVYFYKDTITPSFTGLGNISIYNNESINLDINATDSGVGIDSYSINWTTLFAINKTTGILTNTSSLSSGFYWINVSVNDTLGNTNSSLVYINITLMPDTSYPTFSNYQDNNASIVSGETALFNVTVANTNGSVWLSINGTNYTATNLTSNKYNVSITGLTNNTYAYNWSAYGNGSSKLFNKTGTKSFTINPPVTAKINLDWIYPLSEINVSQNYFFNITVNVSCKNANCGNINVTLDPSGEQSKIICIYDYKGTGCGGSLNLASTNLCNYGYSAANSYKTSNANLSSGTQITNVSLTMWHTACDTNPISIYLNGVRIYIQSSDVNRCSCDAAGNWPTTIILNSTQITAFSNNWNYNEVNAVSINKSSTLYNSLSFLNITYNSGKGDISTTIGSTPFYTNVTNPYNLTLNENESQIITWFVNATGSSGNYTFFVYANKTSDMSIGNITRYINVSLLEDIFYPIFSSYWDNNGTLVGSGLGLFNVTLTNTNGSVWLEINNTNTTAINLTSNVYTINYTFLTNATYNYKWWAYGNGTSRKLNSSSQKSYRVNPGDRSPPSITILSPSNRTYAINSINITVELNENTTWCGYSLDGTANVSLTSVNLTYFNSTKSSLSEGSHTLLISCNDSYGNMNTTSPRIFITDTVKPYVAFSSPLNTSYNVRNISLTITNDSDAKSRWYNRGLGNETYTSSTSKIFSEGTNSIIAYANDSANNLNSTTIVFSIDSIAPEITINYPIEQTYITSIIPFNITTNEASSCWFALNSTNNYTMQNNSNTQFNRTLTLPDKSYSITFYCNDSLNNLQTKTRIFGVKTVPPQITLSYPSSNKYYNNYTVHFNYTPMATDGLDTCQLWGNWTGTWHKNDSTKTPSNYSSNYFIKTISDGDYIWNIWCNNTNNANDWSTAGNISFTIDRTPPSISFISPRNVSYNSSILTVQLFNSSAYALWWYNQSNNKTYDYPADINLPDGNYIYTAYANDSAGNINSTEIYFSVDTSVPSFSNYQDNNGSHIGSGIGLFNITLTNTNGTVILVINNQELQATTSYLNVYNASYNFLSEGVYDYYWKSYSAGTSHLQANSETRYYTINATDKIYPIFSNYEDNSGTLITSGTGIFNVSIDNANGSVFFHINNTDYSAENIESNTYQASFEFNSSGTYPYYWFSYGTGFANNYNFSRTINYVVNSFTIPGEDDEEEGGSGITGGATGGGGGGGSAKEECSKDSECNLTYSCFNKKCVKLFDVEIKNIQPIINSNNFSLTYLIKGMAEIKGDVIIKFWIENKDEKIMLGQDAIYLNSFEEKTKTTELNLPMNLKQDAYDLYVQVNFENYKVESFRKVNIKIPEDLINGKEINVDVMNADKISFSSLSKVFFSFLKIILWIVLILIALYLILLVFSKRNKIFKPALKGLDNIITRIQKKIKINKLIGKDVYTTLGKKIGKLESVIHSEEGHNWVIKPVPELNLEKNILVRNKDIISSNEIPIISEKFEKLFEAAKKEVSEIKDKIVEKYKEFESHKTKEIKENKEEKNKQITKKTKLEKENALIAIPEKRIINEEEKDSDVMIDELIRNGKKLNQRVELDKIRKQMQKEREQIKKQSQNIMNKKELDDIIDRNAIDEEESDELINKIMNNKPKQKKDVKVKETEEIKKEVQKEPKKEPEKQEEKSDNNELSEIPEKRKNDYKEKDSDELLEELRKIRKKDRTKIGFKKEIENLEREVKNNEPTKAEENKQDNKDELSEIPDKKIINEEEKDSDDIIDDLNKK